MNLIKEKKLPNNTMMTGYFFNENKESICTINVKKTIYIKKNKIDRVIFEKRPLTISIIKGKDKDVVLESQVSFGNKTFEKIKYYSPEYKTKGFKTTDKTLLQIWNKPLDFKEIEKIVETFVDNDKKHPLNFTSLNTIQSEIKDNWESMELFMLSGEIETPENSFLKEFEIMSDNKQR